MNAKNIKPGVATGDQLQAIFELAKEKQFALPAVNVINSSTVNAVMETAAELNAPAIIQLSNGGAQFYAGKGLDNAGQRACIAGGVSAATHIHQTRRALWRDRGHAYRPRRQETAALDRRPARRR
jgi:fructose-bisphosphate aldolase class II